MDRTLLATLSSALVLPHRGWGRAAVLFGCEGAYQFSGGKSASEGIDGIVAGQPNPDQLTSSGRCGFSLTPT
ncbi:hypothetical protein H6F90_11015 [Trichocoleus sp. FACHB-591]|uniref:hypothetical protein n=1 Tax=Trichocoleus sp. FACHB-591 TaxID=2692872 RepID=UPI0016890AD7|nr:hypothetical protein [Trichocoleus sp. FACHB-591]MBD2095685.1 hypothetical protein [Trichocoleus sp. FACHB-591]